MAEWGTCSHWDSHVGETIPSFPAFQLCTRAFMTAVECLNRQGGINDMVMNKILMPWIKIVYLVIHLPFAIPLFIKYQDFMQWDTFHSFPVHGLRCLSTVLFFWGGGEANSQLHSSLGISSWGVGNKTCRQHHAICCVIYEKLNSSWLWLKVVTDKADFLHLLPRSVSSLVQVIHKNGESWCN